MTIFIRAGTLRKRVSIQSRSTALDSFGGQSTTWATIATVWAEIVALSGREVMLAQAERVEVSHTITMRYQPIFAAPITVAAYRVLYQGRIFNVRSSENVDERNRVILFTCNEGLNDG